MPPLSGEPPHLFEPERAFPKLNVTENPKEIHTENLLVVDVRRGHAGPPLTEPAKGRRVELDD